MRASRMATPIGGIAAAGASVVCMASMGAMAVASVAGGMAGMGAAAATAPHVPTVTRTLRALGLDGLTHVPNAVLQPLLIILLLVASGTALWRARAARTIQAVALAIIIAAAAVGLYVSIYLATSETGYWIALTILVVASVLAAWTSRRGGALQST